MTAPSPKIRQVEALAAVADAHPTIEGADSAVRILMDRHGVTAKEAAAKLERLADKGLTEYGVSVVYGWLTDKGKRRLSELTGTVPVCAEHPWVIRGDVLVPSDRRCIAPPGHPGGHVIYQGDDRNGQFIRSDGDGRATIVGDVHLADALGEQEAAVTFLMMLEAAATREANAAAESYPQPVDNPVDNPPN